MAQTDPTPGSFGIRVRPLKPLTPLTVEQFLTYTLVSALVVVAYDTDGICGGTTPSFRYYLLLLATLLLIHLQMVPDLHVPRDPKIAHELGRVVYSAVLVGSVRSSGWVVDAIGPWIRVQPGSKTAVGMEETEQEMDLLQMKALHLFLAWFTVSEAEYWRLRAVAKYKNVKHPDYFFIPLDNVWMPRLFPWYPALYYFDVPCAADSTFWSARIWKLSFVECSIMFPWFLSLWTIHYAFRYFINPSYTGNGGILFANGHDTLFSREDSLGLSILCTVLVRPVRKLHAALFKWMMDKLCVLVEGRRERRRLRRDEKESCEI